MPPDLATHHRFLPSRKNVCTTTFDPKRTLAAGRSILRKRVLCSGVVCFFVEATYPSRDVVSPRIQSLPVIITWQDGIRREETFQHRFSKNTILFQFFHFLPYTVDLDAKIYQDLGSYFVIHLKKTEQNMFSTHITVSL